MQLLVVSLSVTRNGLIERKVGGAGVRVFCLQSTGLLAVHSTTVHLSSQFVVALSASHICTVVQ